MTPLVIALLLAYLFVGCFDDKPALRDGRWAVTIRRTEELLLLAAVAVFLLGVGACAPKPDLSAPPPVVVTRVEVKPPLVAKSDLTCMVEPAPLADNAVQSDQTDYSLDLVEAGRDCRRRLGKVRDALGRAKP